MGFDLEQENVRRAGREGQTKGEITAYNSLGEKLCRYDESPGFSRRDEEDISDRGQGRSEVTGGAD